MCAHASMHRRLSLCEMKVNDVAAGQSIDASKEAPSTMSQRLNRVLEETGGKSRCRRDLGRTDHSAAADPNVKQHLTKNVPSAN